MKHGAMVISLDFELLWGVFDKVGSKVDTDYFVRTRGLIPRMLDLFEKYGIQVTWATVGMLFAENEEEWKVYQPKQVPSYRNLHYSAYDWSENNGLNQECHFAPDLIKLIQNCPGQEIASHTFAHYYTLLRGQTPQQFQDDLRAAQKIAGDKFGIKLKSLVFPRNHVNLLYMDLCYQEGFEQVRINPPTWYWQEAQHEGVLKKIFRSADCFFPIGKTSSFKATDTFHWNDQVWMIPASRILKPYQKANHISNTLRIKRIKSEIKTASRQHSIYHLWWHPHNFALDPESALKELEHLLQYFKQLHETNGFESLSMEGLGHKLNRIKKSKNLQIS
jgi:peptidoglycan/xylan/chitin deacetylase (PgdA/CDA1 family)